MKYFVSPWFSKEDVLSGKMEGILEVGDLLEFERVSYKHWAVYVGSKRVVHKVSSSMSSGSLSKARSLNRKGSVVTESLLDVLGGGRVRINNGRDRVRLPNSPHYTSLLATKASLLDDLQLGKYNLLTSNCEHFVNWCRYDHLHSSQVVQWVSNTLAGTSTIAALTGLLFITGKALRLL